MRIKNGSIVAIEGCPVKSKMLEQWFGQEPKTIQHFCIGFNPGATLSGKILEAERAWGAISIGVARYPSHSDGVIKSPTILADDEPIEQEGVFIHKDLCVLGKSLISGQQK